MFSGIPEICQWKEVTISYTPLLWALVLHCYPW